MIERLYIKGTEEKPEVVLDKQSGTLGFSGKSLPENAPGFYAPVMEWLEEYISDPHPETSISFSFEYINSSSIVQVIDFLVLCEKIHEKDSKIQVTWLCEEGDDLMEMKGQEIKEIVNLPFTIEYRKD